MEAAKWMSHLIIVHKIPTVVDFNQNLEKLIKQAKYDKVDRNILTMVTINHSQSKGQIQLNLHLVQFKNSGTTNEIIKEMTKMNLLPASHIELLNFGIRCPDIHQSSSMIIALGSYSVSHEDLLFDNGLPQIKFYYSLIGQKFSDCPRRLHLIQEIEKPWPESYSFLACPLEEKWQLTI